MAFQNPAMIDRCKTWEVEKRPCRMQECRGGGGEELRALTADHIEISRNITHQ